MSECDATVGQVAKGTTASFALGPHGASVCGCVEEALPGVGVVGGVWALVGGCADGVCGVFGGRIVPFAPAVEVFGGIALDSVPADGFGVDEIGVFGALGVVFVPVFGRSDGVCGAFGGVCGVFGSVFVPFAPVGGVFGGVAVGLVPAGGVDVDEIGVFGALGTVFGLVGGRSDGVCGAFGGRIVLFAPVGAVFSGVGEGSDGVCGAFGGVCGGCAFAVGVFGSAAAACGVPEGETGAKRSASDGAGGADVDEATEEGAAERRLC